MPQVSKNPLHEETYKRIYLLFLETISSVKNKQSLSTFLKDLLTPTEQIMLSKRIVICYLLEKGYNYQEIIETIHVSSSTVSRINLIYTNSKSMQKAIRKLTNEKKFEELLLDIGIMLSSVLDFPKSKTKFWKNVNTSLTEDRKNKF